MNITANDLAIISCYRDSERRRDAWMVEQAIDIANKWLWQASVIDSCGAGALAAHLEGWE